MHVYMYIHIYLYTYSTDIGINMYVDIVRVREIVEAIDGDKTPAT